MTWETEHLKCNVVKITVMQMPGSTEEQYLQATMRIRSAHIATLTNTKTGKILHKTAKPVNKCEYWVIERNLSLENPKWLIIDMLQQPETYTHVPSPRQQQKAKKKQNPELASEDKGARFSKFRLRDEE